MKFKSFKKKIILVVIDGLADEKIPQLKNKTPLEVAETPNLDFLTKNGICGLIVPWVENKKQPTSEDTHLALFGYDPKKTNPGRGVLEAMGIGAKIKKNDICLRGNFATVNEDLTIIDRRAGRVEKTENLVLALNRIKVKGAKIIVKKSFGHRVILILRGKNLSEKITSNDPKEVGVKVFKILCKEKKAKKTVKILNEFLEKARSILKNHIFNKERIKNGKLPANYLLLRGAGKIKKVKNFKEKYNLKAAFVAGGTLYKGIGKYLGMEEIKVKGANGMANTNLKGKIWAVKNQIKNFDFIFLHIKAADTFAEDGNFLGKKEFIEKIDRNLKPILNLKDVLIVITCDHPTSCLKKSHFFGKNPVLIFGNGTDKVKKFSEESCKRGKLGIFYQKNLLKKIFTIDKKFSKK